MFSSEDLRLLNSSHTISNLTTAYLQSLLTSKEINAWTNRHHGVILIFHNTYIYLIIYLLLYSTSAEGL